MAVDPKVLKKMMEPVPLYQKPMVTREQYDRAREVLDSLPSGVYIKCAKCQGWYSTGTITLAGLYTVCEGCS